MEQFSLGITDGSSNSISQGLCPKQKGSNPLIPSRLTFGIGLFLSNKEIKNA